MSELDWSGLLNIFDLPEYMQANQNYIMYVAETPQESGTEFPKKCLEPEPLAAEDLMPIDIMDSIWQVSYAVLRHRRLASAQHCASTARP